ncbi:hypothetical protein KAK06_00810 [Ideonella sp. 4Y11]|uniref:Uncharacterized protein n=1 Tax=Ideonella aquatica TaxID=2824119 RepID=A0A940YC71_9BURK|nr:hypothetical protein [Ideonella aquatica]MBQ0957485.1 hypothetical protein [Ideonella aquatica]
MTSAVLRAVALPLAAWLLAGPALAATGTPVVLHALIDLTDHVTSPLGSSQLKAHLHLRTPMTRQGPAGPRAVYQQDPSARSSFEGSVQGEATTQVSGDGVSMQETLSMRAEWPTARTPGQPLVAHIVAPGDYALGEGLVAAIKLELPIHGVWQQRLNGQLQQNIHSSTILLPGCSLNSTTQAGCRWELTLTPPSTQVRDPLLRRNAQAQEVLAQQQAVEGNPDARGRLLALGSVLAVPTRWLDNGHLLLAADRAWSSSEDGSRMARHLTLTVWSANPGDEAIPASR